MELQLPEIIQFNLKDINLDNFLRHLFLDMNKRQELKEEFSIGQLVQTLTKEMH